MELLFDTGLGIYVVVDHVDLYFYEDRFIRIRNGAWQVSATLDGPWKIRSARHVPAGLRSKQHGKKQKHHGRGAAKGAW